MSVQRQEIRGHDKKSLFDFVLVTTYLRGRYLFSTVQLRLLLKRLVTSHK